MKSQWIVHNGKRILYMDLSNFNDNARAFEAELREAVATVGQEMYSQPLHSVLVLVDFRNTAMTQAAQKLVMDRINDTKKYIAKTAVVGMTGIRKIFLDFFARIAASETGSFEEPEAAKEWLAR
jgi:hypothetical protein